MKNIPGVQSLLPWQLASWHAPLPEPCHPARLPVQAWWPWPESPLSAFSLCSNLHILELCTPSNFSQSCLVQHMTLVPDTD